VCEIYDNKEYRSRWNSSCPSVQHGPAGMGPTGLGPLAWDPLSWDLLAECKLIKLFKIGQ